MMQPMSGNPRGSGGLLRGSGGVRVALATVIVLGGWAGAVAQENRTSPSNYTSLPSSVPAVYGYVTDAEGKPVQQARVEIYLRSEFRADYAVTDNNGFYIIVVPERSDFWEVRVQADGFLMASTQVGVFRRERVDFALRPDPRAWERPNIEPRERTRARKTMQEGLSLARAGKRDQALELLREAVRIDPEYAAAHNNLAVNLRMIGELAEAERQLRTAIEIAPLDYHANYNLGSLLYDTGRTHEAVPSLLNAVIADPTSPLAEAMLGRAYLALGLSKQALEHLEEAQDMGGEDIDLALEISDAYVVAGRLAKALKVKTRWLANHADDPRAERVAATVATLEARMSANE